MQRWLALLPLVLTCLQLAAAARPVKKQLAKPDYTVYHTMAGVFGGVDALVRRPECSGMMRVENHTLTVDGYSSTMTVVTVEPGGLTADHRDKARLLVNFGEHGRELISSEIGLAVLEALCNRTARAALLREFHIDAEVAEAALSQSVFQVVPMENVHGRELVEAGKLCERKNGRGVDPNRNWGVHWGHKEPDYDPNEEYPGTAPFSEPESAMLRALGEAWRPHVWLTVHSGMEALFLPYDHKDTVPEGAAAAATLAILEELNRKVCGGRCAVGSGGKAVGYLAHGTATDYMHDRLGAAVALTWEVYGDMNATIDDCFRMFNPQDKERYDGVVRAWSAALFALLAALPGHPGIEPLADVAAAAAAASSAGAREVAIGLEERRAADAAAVGAKGSGAGAAGVSGEAAALGQSGASAAEERLKWQAKAGAGGNPAHGKAAGSSVRPWAAAFSVAEAGSRAAAASRYLAAGAGIVSMALLALWSRPRLRRWLNRQLGRRRRQDIPS